METLAILSTALGTSWTSGINLYATVATLGVMHHFEAIELPGSLDSLGSWPVIGVAAFLYCLEFFADKIPYLDTVWDAIHTFIRVPAGAALAAAAVSDMGSGAEAIALLLGGGTSLVAHGSKAATRVAVNTSPEPLSNIALSTGEDAFVFGLVSLIALHPIVAGVIVVAILAVTIWFLPKLVRALAGLFRKAWNIVTFWKRETPAPPTG